MWRELKSLPRHDGQGWAQWRHRVCRDADADTLKSDLRSWSPTSLTLVAGPGDRRFLPPVYQRQFRGRAMDAVRRSCRLAVSSWTGFCLVLIGLALMTRTPRYASYALLFGLVAATIATDYFAALRTASGIGERALFFRWMQTAAAPRVGLVAWSLLLGLSGATQLLLQDRLGSLESVVEQYGIVYSEVLQQGQWWRVLSGSFLHAGLAHYANNAMLLLFTGPIVWGLFGAGRSLIIFASGTVVGPLAQMAFGTPEFDSYLGLSSPVLAMFGLLIASAWRNPRVLPKGFPLTLIGIVTVSVVGAELLSERVASSAHVAGLAVGVLFGLRVPTLAEDHRVSGAASRRGAVRHPVLDAPSLVDLLKSDGR